MKPTLNLFLATWDIIGSVLKIWEISVMGDNGSSLPGKECYCRNNFFNYTSLCFEKRRESGIYILQFLKKNFLPHQSLAVAETGGHSS